GARERDQLLDGTLVLELKLDPGIRTRHAGETRLIQQTVPVTRKGRAGSRARRLHADMDVVVLVTAVGTFIADGALRHLDAVVVQALGHRRTDRGPGVGPHQVIPRPDGRGRQDRRTGHVDAVGLTLV